MDLREVFAANLRRLRHANDLSQDDLAYEAEVSRSYLSRLPDCEFAPALDSRSSVERDYLRTTGALVRGVEAARGTSLAERLEWMRSVDMATWLQIR